MSSKGLDVESLPLWSDLVDVRWLTAFDCEVLRERGGPADIDRRRTLQGFLDATSVDRTVKAIDHAASLPGFERKVRHLRNWRLRALSGDDTERESQSRDHLYEIEIAARLRHSLSDLRFDEPDLLAHDPITGFKFAVACKRPRTLKSFTRAARTAIAQVRKSDAVGAVVLSADNLLERIVADLSGDGLLDECRRRVTRIISATSGAILESMSEHPPRRAGRGSEAIVSGVIGALVTGSFLLMGKDGPAGPSFLNTGFVPAMINRNRPEWARLALATLLHLLQQGEDSLVAMP